MLNWLIPQSNIYDDMERNNEVLSRVLQGYANDQLVESAANTASYLHTIIILLIAAIVIGSFALWHWMGSRP